MGGLSGWEPYVGGCRATEPAGSQGGAQDGSKPYGWKVLRCSFTC